MECQKTKFRTKQDADINIAQIKRRTIGSLANPETPRKIPMRAYLCPDCGSWHLTSKLKSYDELNEEIEFVNERFAKMTLQFQRVVSFDNTEVLKRKKEVKDLQTAMKNLHAKYHAQKEKLEALQKKHHAVCTERDQLKSQLKKSDKTNPPKK